MNYMLKATCGSVSGYLNLTIKATLMLNKFSENLGDPSQICRKIWNLMKYTGVLNSSQNKKLFYAPICGAVIAGCGRARKPQLGQQERGRNGILPSYCKSYRLTDILLHFSIYPPMSSHCEFSWYFQFVIYDTPLFFIILCICFSYILRNFFCLLKNQFHPCVSEPLSDTLDSLQISSTTLFCLYKPQLHDTHIRGDITGCRSF